VNHPGAGKAVLFGDGSVCGGAGQFMSQNVALFSFFFQEKHYKLLKINYLLAIDDVSAPANAALIP
jgi:hypothetical protein